jgi:hypothetical protein
VSNPVITGSGTSGTTDFQNGVRIKKGTAISIDLDAIGSNIFAGGPSNDDGDIVLYQKGVSDIRDTGKAALHLDAGASKIIIRDANFKVRCQIDGKNSDLNLFSQNQRSTIFLDGSAGNCWIGGNGQDGDLVVVLLPCGWGEQEKGELLDSLAALIPISMIATLAQLG